MEVNRDESLRCVEIAEAARASGDLGKAERFLRKSIQLFPTPKAEAMLRQTQADIAAPPAAQKPSATPKSPSANPSSPSSSSSSASTSSGSTSQAADFTAEQRDSARAIKRLKNHYEILGVQKTCTEAEIKIAYRKMALKFHPDKNRAPEAEDAFKIVSTAFQTLSDPQKRAHFDQYGSESQFHQSPTQRTHFDRSEDISPEEIFNMFFGQMGGFQQTGRRTTFRTNFRPPQRRTQTNNQPAGEAQPNSPASFFMQFVHFLPIILLILFSFFSSPSSESELPFSFTQNRAMSIQRKTPKFGVEYFVNQNFQYRYARDYRALQTVESRVEQEFMEKLDRECKEQQANIDKLRKKAKAIRDSIHRAKELEKVESMTAESCEKRTELFVDQ